MIAFPVISLLLAQAKPLSPVQLIDLIQYKRVADDNDHPLNLQFQKLTKDSAPILNRALRDQKDSHMVALISEKLIQFDYRPSIETLINLIEREFTTFRSQNHPSKAALQKWSYKATPAVLRHLRDDRTNVRFACQQIIVDGVPLQRKDVRVHAAIYDMAESQDRATRTIGVSGLKSLAFEFHQDRMGDGNAQVKLHSEVALDKLCAIAFQADYKSEIMNTLRNFVIVSESKMIPSNNNKYVLNKYVQSENENYRLVAAFIIASELSADDRLLQLLTDQSPRIQKIMIEGFRHNSTSYQVDYPDVIAILKQLTNHSDSNIRLSIASCLEALHHPLCEPLLNTMSKDSDPKVASIANRALRQIPKKVP